MGRQALLLVPIAFASRGAAFVVPLVVAAWYGVSDITDAWFWALAFPTFALVLAGTALGTATTPALSEVKATDPGRLPTFLGGMLLATTLGSGLLGAAICAGAPFVLARFTDFDAPTQALAAAFLWELLPFMVLTSAGAVLRVANEVHGRFTVVALTPLLRAAVVIGATALLRPRLGPHALPAGLVIGEAVQLLWWAAALGQRGLWPRLTFTLDPAIRRVGRDLAPILGGEVLVAMNLVIDKAFAAGLPTGAVATLEYADRARVIPQTLLESTLLMVAFATWSNLRAAGRPDEARAAVDQALRWTLALSAPIVAGMFIGRIALVRLLYERGAFTPEDTLATAEALAFYLPGVVPNLMGILALRAHIVERNLHLVLRLGLLSVIANCVLNALLVGPLGLPGLALATTIVMVLIPGLYLRLLWKTLPRDPGRWRPVWGLLAATLVVVALAEQLGPPEDIGDLRLWAWSVPCLLLLGLGWRLTQGRPAA